ncbi:hypothetical protein CL630_01345 [bacterium]|nr:hypothetical protein [bacterium]|tara:strand:- start:13601 stop:14236 length:636 start_codon:yes stop_codon:yes gene_type:complete
MDILTKLFGSTAYVKIMRLFLFNPGVSFETKDVRMRTQVLADTTRRELAYIHSLGLIKRKNFVKEVVKKTKSGEKVVKRKVRGWVLDENFQYIEPLRHILLNSDSFQKENIVNRFKKVGRLKLLVVSGIFVDELERTENRGRIDVLVVGDHLKHRIIKVSLKNLESEIGRELQYSVLKTDDFLYRKSVYDKFIRDVFDYPHEVLVDKMGVI